MQCHKLLATGRVHLLHVRSVGPETVVNRGKGDPSVPEVDGGEHHVGGVQGVDEVGREPVPVLRRHHFQLRFHLLPVIY